MHDVSIVDDAARPKAGWIALIGLLVATAAATGFGLLFSTIAFDKTVILALAAAVGCGLAVLAATRFWLVVVLLFAVRSSLDALRFGGGPVGSEAYRTTTSSLNPGVIVGLVFLLAAAAWLVAQWRSGEMFPWSWPARCFAALAAACTVSAAGSGNPLESGQLSLKVWAGALMVVVLEQAYRQRPERIRAILGAAALSLVVPTLVAVAQARSASGTEAYLAVSRVRGTFVHSNPFASYLVLLAVGAMAVRPHLAGWARRIAWLVFGAASAVTVLTYARGAWAALLVGLIVIGVLQDRRMLAGLAVGIVLVVVAVPSVTSRLSDLNDQRQTGRGDPNSLAWRVSYWNRLLPQMAKNPVTGIGLEQVVATTPEQLQPHNVFVQAAVETGLVGLGSLVALCATSAVALRRAVRRAPAGLGRGVAVGALAGAFGILLQLGSENLLTQAAIHWYLAIGLAWATAMATSPEPLRLAGASPRPEGSRELEGPPELEGSPRLEADTPAGGGRTERSRPLDPSTR